MLQMFKIKLGKAPIYLRILTPNNVEARTRYALRNNANMDIPVARIEAYSKSFFPATACSWNTLPQSLKGKYTVNAFKYAQYKLVKKANPLFYFGERRVSVIHSKLCVKCSALRGHLFHELHVIDSPLCPCDSGAEEDNDHYLLNCTKFTEQRRAMQISWRNLGLPWPPPVDHLLYGIPDQPHPINIHVFSIVHQYIFDSNRFV